MREAVPGPPAPTGEDVAPEVATAPAPARDDGGSPEVDPGPGPDGPRDSSGSSRSPRGSERRRGARRGDLRPPAKPLEPPAPPPPPARFSLPGRVTGAVFLAIAAGLAAGALVGRFELPPLVSALAAALVALPAAAWAIGRLLAPLDRVVRGVADGIRSFRDHDFSVRLAHPGDDELGELVRLYNEVGRLLQEERHLLRQRELLLQTALDRSPAAILLVGPTGRIVYSNREARRLLLGGGTLEGKSFGELRAGCPPEMQEVLASDTDGLFTVRSRSEDGREIAETYHLSRRAFQLNYRHHDLVLLRRLTGELGRQEAEIWKKVLRVLSHELNNSLAPISSLVHSARIVASDPRHAHRADEVFDTLRERVDHLQRFLEGYARFARLPRPRKEEVDWERFVDSLGVFPQVRLLAPLPASPGWFDPAQLSQVLVNLYKNAVEAGPDGAEVGLRVEAARDEGTWIQVSDRGRGMDEETMRQALLPFYSTKPGGSGLGLALCREILEAHGGKISLQSLPGEGTVVTCWLPPK